MKFKIKKKFFGVTLIELVFAVSIFAISVIPIFGNLTNNLKASKKSETYLQAQNLSKSILNVLLEKVRFKSLIAGYYSKDGFNETFEYKYDDMVENGMYNPLAFNGGWGPITTTPLNNEAILNVTLGQHRGAIEGIQVDVKSGDEYLMLGDFIDFEKEGGNLVGNGRIIKFNVFYEFLLHVEDVNTTFNYLRNKMDASKPNETLDSASITVNGEIKYITLHCYWLNEEQKNHFTLATIVTKDREDTDPI
jgi:type II secretory pathway pseudopilin PulG